MIRFCLTLFIFVLYAATAAGAADGVECRLSVYQYDGSTQRDVLLHEDTSVFAPNVTATGFLGPFSLEIEFRGIDTAGVVFNVHVVTLGPPVNTYSRSFTMEFALPARLSGIEGKNGARYTLVITPLSIKEIDTGCPYDHRGQSVFQSTPSAYMDLYYVPSSLADYHWQSVRNYLDYSYRRFMTFANFTLPGKMLIYLSPCPIYSVIWDKRFGMAVDPTRNIAFAIYNEHVNGADPFVVTFTALLRNNGYAPPFLSEGLANYYSFALPDMRRILAERPEFSVEDFLGTLAYMKADPFLADRSSACFAKYLVERFSLGRVMEVYKAADDLNLKETLESVLGQPFSQLEADFKVWVDTVSTKPADYSTAAALAEQMLNYPLMLQQAQRCLAAASDKRDSVRAYDLLTRAYFNTGDYYGATEAQTKMIELGNDSPRTLMARAAYRMMNGYYDEARQDLEKAHSSDTTDQMVRFNLAVNCIYRGDEAAAKDLLLNNISFGKEASAQAETRIFLAQILEKSKDSADIKQAAEHYRVAASMYERTLQIQRSSATHYLWLGIATFGLNEVTTAIDYLRVADFLETRPFYSGMIHLWLGKAYLRSGMEDEARAHLTQVLSMASADYHQSEARTYLEQL